MAAAMSRRNSTWALGALSGTCATPPAEPAIITPRTTMLPFTPLPMRASRTGIGLAPLTAHRLPLTPFQYDRPPHHARLDVERSLEHCDRLRERLAPERRGEAQPDKRAVAQHEVAVEPAIQ